MLRERFIDFLTSNRGWDLEDFHVHRLVFLNASSLMGAITLLGFALLHAWLGSWWLSLAQFLLALACIVNLRWLRHSRKLELAGTNLLLVSLILLILLLLHGGINKTGPYWLIILPILAFFLKGVRGGIPWLLTMLLVVLGLAGLQALDIQATPFPVTTLLILFISLLAIATLLLIYEMSRSAVQIALQKSDERLRYLAHHDPLTGLPNRLLFFDRLDQAMARAKRRGARVAVLFLDLDDFKPVNDMHGHDAGDELLAMTAGRLQATLRAVDTVARYGGDEFLVIQDDWKTEDDVLRVARNLIDSLDSPFSVRGDDCLVGVSIGISIYPDHALDADALVTRADKAMYQAKARGKNHYQIYTGNGGGGLPR